MSIFEEYIASHNFKHVSRSLISRIRSCAHEVFDSRENVINKDIFTVIAVYAIEMFFDSLVSEPLCIEIKNELVIASLQTSLEQKVQAVKNRNDVILPFLRITYRIYNINARHFYDLPFPAKQTLSKMNSPPLLKREEFVTVFAHWSKLQEMDNAYLFAGQVFHFVVLAVIRDWVREPEYAFHLMTYMKEFFSGAFKDYFRLTLLPGMRTFTDKISNDLLLYWSPNLKIVTNTAPSAGSSSVPLSASPESKMVTGGREESLVEPSSS